MSLAEIESELEKLSPAELRRLAFKSWSTFVAKEGGLEVAGGCDEVDPELLTALDEAMQAADATPGQGYSGAELRTRIGEWTTR
jgi:hypothetical protein